MKNAPVAIYNASLELVAYLENATGIAYKMRKGEVWSASFCLPADDAKNAECQDFYYAEIYDGDKRVELFRIVLNGKSRIKGKPVIKYECKHALCTFNDDTMVGEHNAGPGVTAALNYILGKQVVAHWQLGTVEFVQNFYHYWKDLSLLAALYTIPERFLTAHRWTFDTTSHPWTLNLLNAPTAVSARIAYRKNMQQIDRKSDVRNLYTRLYPYGYGAGAAQVDISTIDLAAKGRPGFTSGSTEFTVGETLTGATSVATAKVKTWYKVKGAWGTDDAEGVVFLTDVTGTFTDGEDLNGSVSGDNCATLDSSLECVYAENVTKYGVITRKWEDQRYTVVENLYAAAEERVDANATPELTYTAKAADLYRLTKRGQFVLNNLVKVYDGPLAINVDARVVGLSKKDVQGKPGDIDVQLGNKIEKFPDFGGIVYADDLDQVKDGIKWGRVLSTQILAGKILLSAVPGSTIGAFPATPTVAGLYVGATHFGFHDGTNWITYTDIQGRAMWEGIGGDSGHIHWDPAAGGSLDILGAVTVTAGVVGGFNVDPTEGLYIGTGATRVQMKPGVGIWCGATAIENALFSATNAGVMTAKSGTIGGFTISATALTGGIIRTAAYGSTRAEMQAGGSYPHLFITTNVNVVESMLRNGEVRVSKGTDAIGLTAGAVAGQCNLNCINSALLIDVQLAVTLQAGGGVITGGAGKIINLRYCDLELATSTVTGTLATGNIPNLDAGKITSGTFNTARIPGLDASKIISGAFNTARIPGLAASKIVSGVFDDDRIPATISKASAIKLTSISSIELESSNSTNIILDAAGSIVFYSGAAGASALSFQNWENSSGAAGTAKGTATVNIGGASRRIRFYEV